MSVDAVERLDARADRNAHRRNERAFSWPTVSSAPSSPYGWRSRTSTRPWRVSYSAAILRGFTLGALRCGRIIERSGISASMPPSLVWSSPRPRPCRSWSDRSWLRPARRRWVRLRRALHHDRELAQRKGPAIGARAGLLALHGRHVRRPSDGTAADRPGQDRDSSTIQCDRLPVRRGAGHGEHHPGRAAQGDHRREAALRPANARGPRRGHRLRVKRPRQRLVLRARSGVDAGRGHRTRDDRAVHACGRARRARIPDPGRPVVGPLRPAHRAGRPRLRLRGHRRRPGPFCRTRCR